MLFASHTNQFYSSRQCWKMVVGSDTPTLLLVPCNTAAPGLISSLKLVMKIQSFRQHKTRLPAWLNTFLNSGILKCWLLHTVVA